ncbi:hypothetical protein R1sor_016352 [Riccia sorocarpa]|uniref:tRNA-uridine aminocarboxypropyltransferase n=1 Tax=Riccia sorocarpa TaxID=122646 RepID=A0ABD3HF62_9MARC
MAPKRKGGPENTLYSYKGVRQRSSGKWVAEIRVPGGKKDRGKVYRLWLGTFNTAEEAARRYNEKAIELYGERAQLNFIHPQQVAVSGNTWVRQRQFPNRSILPNPDQSLDTLGERKLPRKLRLLPSWDILWEKRVSEKDQLENTPPDVSPQQMIPAETENELPELLSETDSLPPWEETSFLSNHQQYEEWDILWEKRVSEKDQLENTPLEVSPLQMIPAETEKELLELLELLSETDSLPPWEETSFLSNHQQYEERDILWEKRVSEKDQLENTPLEVSSHQQMIPAETEKELPELLSETESLPPWEETSFLSQCGGSPLSPDDGSWELPGTENLREDWVRQRSSGKWVAEIRAPEGKTDRGKVDRLWLGTFDTVEKAAPRYNEKAIELYGEKAPLNFIHPQPVVLGHTWVRQRQFPNRSILPKLDQSLDTSTGERKPHGSLNFCLHGTFSGRSGLVRKISWRSRKRNYCKRCWKAASRCICKMIEIQVNNQTRITILQHPLENIHHLGTARLAVVGLRNVELICVPEEEDQMSCRMRAQVPGLSFSLLHKLQEKKYPFPESVWAILNARQKLVLSRRSRKWMSHMI